MPRDLQVYNAPSEGDDVSVGINNSPDIGLGQLRARRRGASSCLDNVQRFEIQSTAYVSVKTEDELKGIGGLFMERLVTVEGTLGVEDAFRILSLGGLVKMAEFRSQLPELNMLSDVTPDIFEKTVQECDLQDCEYMTKSQFFRLFDMLETNAAFSFNASLLARSIASLASPDGATSQPRFITQTDAARRYWDILILCRLAYCWVSGFLLFFTEGAHIEVLCLDAVWLLVHYCDVAIRRRTAEHSYPKEREREELSVRYLREDLFPDIVQGLPDMLLPACGVSGLVWKLVRLKNLSSFVRLRWYRAVPVGASMGTQLVQYYFYTVPVLLKILRLLCAGHTFVILRMLLTYYEPDCQSPDACADTTHEQYFYSTFYVGGVLTTQGPLVQSLECTIFAAWMCLVCLLLQGHIMAEMSAIMIIGNIKEENRNNMRESMALLRHFDVLPSLQQEVLSFNFHTLGLSSAVILRQSLSVLPAPMISEVLFHIKVMVIEGISMFCTLGLECTVALANCLEQETASPDQTLINYGGTGKEMYVLMYGYADVLIPSNTEWHSVATLVRGEVFGEMALLRPTCPRAATVKALTYCDLFTLLVQDFLAVQDTFSQLRVRMEIEARRRGLFDEPPQPTETPATSSLGGSVACARLGKMLNRSSPYIFPLPSPEPQDLSAISPDFSMLPEALPDALSGGERMSASGSSLTRPPSTATEHLPAQEMAERSLSELIDEDAKSQGSSVKSATVLTLKIPSGSQRSLTALVRKGAQCGTFKRHKKLVPDAETGLVIFIPPEIPPVTCSVGPVLQGVAWLHSELAAMQEETHNTLREEFIKMEACSSRSHANMIEKLARVHSHLAPRM